MPDRSPITVRRKALAAGLAAVGIVAAASLTGCSTSSPKRLASTASTTVTVPATAVQTSTTQAVQGTVVTTTTAPAPAPNFGVFAGTWTYHGAAASIGLDGRGTADWRIYKWCSDDPTPPCDDLVNNNIIDGGHASFRLTGVTANTAYGIVSQTTDTKTVASGPLVLRVTADDHLEFPNFSQPLCGPHSPPGTCGA